MMTFKSLCAGITPVSYTHLDVYKRQQYINCITPLINSALAHFDAHFAPYLRCFQSRTGSVEAAARLYLHGRFQSDRRNLERMAEQVAGSHYQRLHHMLSESAWRCADVRHQLIQDANGYFGHGAALVFDESALEKKGEKSAGVARRWLSLIHIFPPCGGV